MIDFEIIRTTAVKTVSSRLPDDDAGKVLKTCAEVSSEVTKQMLIGFYEQLRQADLQETP
mgnify:CR=1 FL=1